MNGVGLQTLDEVADALNLRPAVIQGLENDHYEEVPVPAYRRGYLRSYAQLLGIDDRQVLDAYRTHFGSTDTEQRVTPVQINRPPSRLGRDCCALRLRPPTGASPVGASR